MGKLSGQVVLVTGASRGIGEAIAVRCAREGASIALLAKTVEADPKLPGTLATAAEAVEAAGGKALILPCDIRDEAQVKEAIGKTMAEFGRLDAVVNNASALNLRPTLALPVARFDLLFQVNARGTFVVTKTCLPHLLRAPRPRILTLAPPLNTDPKWFKGFAPYTLTKYGMTMLTLGWAEEFREQGLGANCLWPKTAIATAAVRNLLGGDEAIRRCRKPEIVADAALAILSKDPRACTGKCFLDEEILRAEGVTDFAPYAVDPDAGLLPDFYI